jgi:hypothetical protein
MGEVSEFWVAALPADQAIAAVLSNLPDGAWQVELAEPQLSADELAKLKLQPGQVMAYSR